MRFTTATIIAASAAMTSAQVPVFNESTGLYNCPASHPEGAYCAGDSLQTNMIIQCDKGFGTVESCDDILAPIAGPSFSPCYQTSETSADAACSKNCSVYGVNGTFQAPGCSGNGGGSGTASSSSTIGYGSGSTSTASTPSYGTTTSAVSSVSTPGYSAPPTTSAESTSKPETTSSVVIVSTPGYNATTSAAAGTTAAASSTPVIPGNGTITYPGGPPSSIKSVLTSEVTSIVTASGTKSASSSATLTSTFNGAVATAQAGGALAFAGLVAAYLL